MRREGASYKYFLTALFTSLALGSLIVQLRPQLHVTLLFWCAFGVAYGFQRWLFGVRHFQGTASSIVAQVKQDEIYFAGQTIVMGDNIENENRLLEEVLNPYRQIGIRLGFGTVVALYVAGVFWLHVELR